MSRSTNTIFGDPILHFWVSYAWMWKTLSRRVALTNGNDNVRDKVDLVIPWDGCVFYSWYMNSMNDLAGMTETGYAVV
jgi:hypothetical protein